MKKVPREMTLPDGSRVTVMVTLCPPGHAEPEKDRPTSRQDWEHPDKKVKKATALFRAKWDAKVHRKPRRLPKP